MNKVVRGKFIPQQLLYFIVGQRCCQRFACTFRSTELETIVKYARAYGLRIILLNGLQECVKVFKQSCKHYFVETQVLTLCHSTAIKMRNILSAAIFVDNDRLEMTKQSLCNEYPKQQSLAINLNIKSFHSSILERPRSSIFSTHSELLKSIYAHRVTLFQADLSNDKSLLIPTIILKDAANRYCNLKIVCIEKENIIAAYNSERLAYKLGENVGKTVGLQVSQKTFISSETHVIYTSPTYFLRSIYKKAYNLNHISHIVVSDVYLHEPYTDILLYELKKSLAINQHIKIILLAQNYDSSPIFAFFGEGTEFCLEKTSQMVSRISYIEDIQNYIKLSEIYKKSNRFKNISQRFKRYQNTQIDDCLQAYEEIGNDVAFWPLLYSITSEIISVNYQHSLTGKSAVFIASQLGNVKHLRLLLYMGADPFVIDNQHENAFSIAKENAECLDTLKNYGVHDYPSKHCKLEFIDYNVLIDIMHLLFSNSCFSIEMSTYLESSKGKFIPATKRPDGTWRKERRVKDGYVPQEEVPLYESKGKQFVSQRQTGVPPGMCPVIAAEIKKAREKKEKLKVKKEEKTEKDTIPKTKSCLSGNSKPNKQIEPAKEPQVALTTKSLEDTLSVTDVQDINISKQIKKLRKKIREIELIENKIEAGSVNTLDKDQLDKVKKKPDILKQLRDIEEIPTAVQRT